MGREGPAATVKYRPDFKIPPTLDLLGRPQLTYAHGAEHFGQECVDRGMTEGKREAFERLAEKRTNAVLEKIRVLSNCSNPYAYSYEEEDIRKIFGAIDRELKIARARFQNHRKREFKLTPERDDG